MHSNKRWKVQLGDEHWVRFTYPRPPGEPFHLLGSIARGAQIGALAEMADGRFVQVNGDHVIPLSDSQVRHAVAAARLEAPRQRPRRAEAARAVIVTVKRRRIVTPA